jgi:hypothetical protein
MLSQPRVYHGMSHQFCLRTGADNDFVGHFAVNRMNGDRPLMSHDPSADAVSDAFVFHRVCLDLNRNKRNAPEVAVVRPAGRRNFPDLAAA